MMQGFDKNGKPIIGIIADEINKGISFLKNNRNVQVYINCLTVSSCPYQPYARNDLQGSCQSCFKVIFCSSEYGWSF
jgi:hypothetical protein